jgi:transcriptional regulator with XRE-family HTH domain
MVKPLGKKDLGARPFLSQNTVIRRKRLGLSQEELAEALSIHPNTIKKIETGISGASPELKEKLATFFRCSLADLYTDPKAIIEPINAQHLTPETLKAIQEATRDSIRQALEESKGLPNDFDSSDSNQSSDLQKIKLLISRLDDNSRCDLMRYLAGLFAESATPHTAAVKKSKLSR